MINCNLISNAWVLAGDVARDFILFYLFILAEEEKKVPWLGIERCIFESGSGRAPYYASMDC